MGRQDVEVVQAELAMCMKSFNRFLRYVKIVETPMPGETGKGTITFQRLPHIDRVIAALLKDKMISILKARQIWISTTLSAYVLWYALSHEGARILDFSKGQPEAKELLSKSHRIYDQLPFFLQLPMNPDSTEEMGFPVMKSLIKAFPSTVSAGISYTASIVVCDEHAEHPYADENFLSSKPTRDGGGQYISVFTENAWNKDNLATTIFEDALAGKNDFTPLFFPYDVIPGRDAAWYEAVKRNIPDRELAGLTPDLYMSKNYPRSIEEALSTPKTVAAFDSAVLTELKGGAKLVSRITVEKEGIDYEYINIYRDFNLGDYFVAASDVSLGVGRDYNVTVIMNVKTGVIVADILDNKLRPEEFAYHSVKLLEIYKNPVWWPEENLWGRVVINMAKTLGYKRFGYRDKERTKPGWFTDEKSRIELFGGLIPAMNNHQITIFNEKGISQFRDIIRNANKNGRIEARSGGNDDYPIAVGICWAKKKDVHTELSFAEPIHTLHFGGRDYAGMGRT